MFYGSLTGFGSGPPKVFGELTDVLSVTFDGTNDYMRTTTVPLTGAANSKTYVVSVWLDYAGSDSAGDLVIFSGFATADYSPWMGRQSTLGHIRNSVTQTGSGTISQTFDTPEGLFTAAAGWQHVLVAGDAAGTNQIYVNDVDRFDSQGTDSDVEGDHTNATNFTIGADPLGGGTRHNGGMA